MKILIVIPSMSIGGTTMSLISLLNCCISKEYDIDVFAINKGNLSSSLLLKHSIGVNGLSTAYYGSLRYLSFYEKIIFLPVKIIKHFSFFDRWLEKKVVNHTIRQINKQKHFDIVVGFQEGLATRFSSHFSCYKKIAWIHCDYAYAYDDSIQELDIYNKFTNIVCVSNFTRQGFVRRYPSLGEKTIAIYNFFDLENILQKAGAVIDDHRFDNSQFTILSIGRVCDVKRFDLIPQIANYLRQHRLKFRWYIMGNSSDSLELSKLTNAIKQFNISREVVYLGSKPNPYPYLKKANLLVSISKSEACPMIFNEAKILHLPILSTNFGSAFEFIEQGKDGYIAKIEQIPQYIMEIANGKLSTSQTKSIDYFGEWNKTIHLQLKQLFS